MNENYQTSKKINWRAPKAKDMYGRDRGRRRRMQ
jgi:hypothetical protein